jgi:cytochrome P450
MTSSLFLQSDVCDPYLIYQSMLDKNPIYWDEENKIWAIYSYPFCVEILENPNAFIPVINPNNKQKLNKYALDILTNLTRLSNGIQHEVTREIAMLLFTNMKAIAIAPIISQLLQNDTTEDKIDWVDSVCKKLPVLVILKSFSFTENDCIFILKKIGVLVQIMLPDKTEDQVKLINEVCEAIFSIVEKQLLSLDFTEPILSKISESHILSPDETRKIFASNLIGLFIQSYDAGRGILSNSLLQIMEHNNFPANTAIEKSIVETLRFDPPIHNTRRVANTAIRLGETIIKKGDKILVVLAAANRDIDKFKEASNFDTERFNNNDNLTFGIGGHNCLAKYFSIHLATEALCFLFKEHKTITLLENNIKYEPLMNARLPKEIWISIPNK